MKKFKVMLAAVSIGLLLPSTITGCAGPSAAETEMQTAAGDAADTKTQAAAGDGAETETQAVAGDGTDTETQAAAGDASNAETDDTPGDAAPAVESAEPQTFAEVPETLPQSQPEAAELKQDYISGKVKELNPDGFLFIQTVVLEDSLVTFVDEKDAKKIPVKYTSDTKFEHWTIKGGGAGITKESASASDITEGMSLEIGGHFEGDDFIAELVLIEVYE